MNSIKNNKIVSVLMFALVGAIIIYMIFNGLFGKETGVQEKIPAPQNASVAYVAGGCFWCVESDLEKLDGVYEVVSGYSGGESTTPTYEDHAGHRETVKVLYNKDVVSYADIIRYYMTHHDPTDAGGSFGDRGHSYTSAVYYQTPQEQATIREVFDELEKEQVFAGEIVTAVEPFRSFYDAEDYHQDYYLKNPIRYNYYRSASGRDTYLKTLNITHETNNTSAWSGYVKPSQDVLKEQLSEEEYYVTQKSGTEQPGTHEFNDVGQGIYVDILSGEPLYSSRDKFDSGTGWPSFTQPIDDTYIVEKKDYKLVWPRTEIRSKYGDNHLGHVFNDGPTDRGGLRYCMNGVALRFVPLEDMESEGYGDYIDKVI